MSNSRNPEATRALILQTALEEFSHEGVAGARTEAIARAAGVNKALLYYYFKDKETLYGAALESVFRELYASLHAQLTQPGDAVTRVLGYAGAHFDFVASHPAIPPLMQREMMRSGRKPSPHLTRVFRKHARPVYEALASCLVEGMRAGHIRSTDPAHTITSMLGSVVFYFISAPGMRIVTGQDPLTPPRLAARRVAMFDYIAHAILTEKGLARLASPNPVQVQTDRSIGNKKQFVAQRRPRKAKR